METLQEWVCILVQRYRRQQAYYLSLAQLSESGSERQREAFERYQQNVWPYVARSKKQELERVKQVMDQIYLQGPLLILRR